MTNEEFRREAHAILVRMNEHGVLSAGVIRVGDESVALALIADGPSEKRVACPETGCNGTGEIAAGRSGEETRRCTTCGGTGAVAA